MVWFHRRHPKQPSPEALKALHDAKVAKRATKAMIQESVAIHGGIRHARESNGFAELIEQIYRP